MTNWDDLRFLVAVSKAGTMSGAARLLGTNTATVSRRIERLSDTLGTPAFVKAADGWQPSPQVAKLIQLAQNFDGLLQSALNARGTQSAATPVHIKLGCFPIVTREILVPGLERHAKALTGISISFHDRIFGDGLGDHDIVLQLGAPSSGRVITRKVGAFTVRVYGYGKAAPGSDWVGLTEEHDAHPIMRTAQAYFGKPPRYRTDSLHALSSIMQATRLPGLMAEQTAAQDPDLAELDPDLAPQVAEIWMLYHESRRTDPGIRLTADWILQCFQDAADDLPETTAVRTCA